jgi:cytochrome b involved in lipid metabolism
VKSHPGGSAVLLRFGGQDATTAFEMVHHSQRARAQLAEYFVGDLDMV